MLDRQYVDRPAPTSIQLEPPDTNNRFITPIVKPTNKAMTNTNEKIFETVSKHDPLEFYANHGIDYQKVKEFLELDRNELSKLAGVSKQSVRLDNKIPRVLKNRLEQIANICNLVATYFEGDPVKTALWFKTMNPMLGGIAPRDMIRFGRYKKLLQFITEASHGDGEEANREAGESSRLTS